ncbi:DNA helicase PcrA [Sporosarcina sp. NCCP-2222]|uniref:ATP-dependent helicase n=1 Tax=Sporosarcina sp. NCCP-2222 TaxID=2935073 RepID=UPI0020897E86|nr:UvrD-helicase domain-containing protein [Sporosarcina sp. NCCP-2222]GKV56003.1 DNA helicase PcrA [Sporosarcina sp. NCCP-2222]
MQLLNGLNANQKQAVVSDSRTILCLAGAGSGKTTVLTRRIAHLFDNRIGTSNMLALTFTRLAGMEMKERVIKLIGEQEGKKLFCNTFHAFAVQVLKEWGHRIGIEKNFSIYDQEDRESILTVILKELGAKTTLKKVFDAFESTPNIRSDEYRVINEYFWKLRQNNAVDLDRLIHKVVELWKAVPESLHYYRQMYSHVFVDEFQDTNDEQMEMFRLLAPAYLFVVGDDFQAIYGWRGAKVEYILNFPSEYPGCETVKLEDNYRSTNEIVTAANNLISYNINQSEKKLIAHKEGPKISVFETGDERTEHEEVLNKIRLLQSEGVALKDIAVLSRTNMQLTRMQSQLDRGGVANIALGRNDIMKNRDIRSIVAWLQVIFNQKDGMALKRALGYPVPFLSENEQKVLKLEAAKREKTELETLKLLDFKQADRFFALGSMIFETASECGVSELILYAAEIMGVIKEYEEQGLQNRLHVLQTGIEYIRSWEESKRNMGEDNSVTAFLSWLKYRDIQEKLIEEKDAVKLMTMHGAKGLEFPVVFLIDLVEDTFPSKRGDLEEERRLAYVGITRAKEKLFLSHSKSKQDWNGSPVFATKSRFLDEILN